MFLEPSWHCRQFLLLPFSCEPWVIVQMGPLHIPGALLAPQADRDDLEDQELRDSMARTQLYKPEQTWLWP
ncbi:hypothetical protein HGM15179_009278 [Zosterops borbonicus]|uniref:Uncharacterized protein n=1 Tax=Zosterops borbonicus TaxID=364589 RepID=A0A8K1LL46_9PASS|nr:hypothetical protein HGM15179_009278 [Zosterops borbonicus]